jgi:2'-hydroxyisoflavone reductase
MSATRRQFLQASLATATGALASSGLLACASSAGGKARKKQRILILGGTSFVGPALIEAALARGHHVTIFNSGRTAERREDAGRPSLVPDEVEVLIGNRDPNLTADDLRLAGDPDIEKKRDPNSPRGLTQLEGRKWDAVIDTSGFFPRMVRASAELLAPSVDQYHFISSISVYAKNDTPGMDETAELARLEDPDVETFGENFGNYGGGKAACEAAAEAAMPGRVANVRPGFIVGPRDTSRRWLYWPWRVAQGGEMLVPGKPEDPVQIIDVRDLAEWCVRLVETRTNGEFNATGPASELSMRSMIDRCKRATASTTAPVWVDAAFLTERGLSFPIWIPAEGETAGFHRVSIARALEAGLRFRPLEETARDSLAWHASLPEEARTAVLPPVDLAREAEVLALWRDR